jgi:DNA-directed RNA polymerase subunit E'
MYKLVTIRDTIRIPPKLFSESLEGSVIGALKSKYEGRIDKDLGIIITVANPRDIGDGRVIPGDGAAYHEAVFDVLVFKPELHEMVRGKVVDITEFGAFVRFGAVDGLVHVSQVTDDFVSYNEKTVCLAGKDSNRVLKKGDVVTARIIAVSMKETLADSKVNLTMRQAGLGKPEWYEKKAKQPGEKAVERRRRGGSRRKPSRKQRR